MTINTYTHVAIYSMNIWQSCNIIFLIDLIDFKTFNFAAQKLLVQSS